MVNYREVGYQRVPYVKSCSREDLMHDCMQMWKGGQVGGKGLDDYRAVRLMKCRLKQRRFRYGDGGCCHSGRMGVCPWL
jgi:hypothetical protein